MSDGLAEIVLYELCELHQHQVQVSTGHLAGAPRPDPLCRFTFPIVECHAYGPSCWQIILPEHLMETILIVSCEQAPEGVMTIATTLQQSLAICLECAALGQWTRLQVGATLISTNALRCTLAVVDEQTRLEYLQGDITVQLGLLVGQCVQQLRMRETAVLHCNVRAQKIVLESVKK